MSRVVLPVFTERVSTQVVVVRELFSLVMSAICVWIRGHRSEVTKIAYHMARVFHLLLCSKGPFPLTLNLYFSLYISIACLYEIVIWVAFIAVLALRYNSINVIRNQNGGP